MIKIRNKRIALLLVLMMLATMFVGVGTASAAGNITALSTPTLVDNPAVGQALGTIKVTVPAGTIKANDSIIFKLPADFDFNAAFGAAAVATHTAGNNEVVVPATLSYNVADVNGLLATNITVTVLDANDEIQLTTDAAQNPAQDFVFYIYLDNIEVADGSSKDCVVTFDGPANTGFPQGTVLVGKSSSTGNVVLTVSGADTSNNNFNFDMRVKEDTAGSLELGLDALELELPDGYVWTTPTIAAPVLITSLWGDNIWVTYTNEDEELDINFVGVDAGVLGTYEAALDVAATATASAWEFVGLAFTVDDESDVTPGAFNMKIKGETGTDISEAKVGTYADFEAAIATEDVPTIIAGQAEQVIADIVITESMAGSLSLNRTIIITLPEGARWQPEYDAASASPPVAPADLADFDRDEALAIDFASYTGSDNRGAKFNITTISTGNEAEVVLEDVEVALEAGFEGDLVATVTGSAGLSGEITLAKAVKAFEATAENLTDVVIGKSGQAAADFTLTEKAAGAFIEDGVVSLSLPAGVTFVGTPTVEVTDGDVKIANVRRTANANNVANSRITFNIDKASDEASTIKVSGINLKIDRTVAEGGISLSVIGNGAVATAAYPDWTNSSTAASATIANVVTSAGYDINNTGVFTIGATTYTINGVERTMDVAPYIANSRTYMPIRYVAYAMGIDDNNILWDGVKRTVTLIKGDKVVQMTIGSKTLLINGAAVTMDVAPEISSDRTMLPAAFVAQAFGAIATWDADTNTVTIK